MTQGFLLLVLNKGYGTPSDKNVWGGPSVFWPTLITLICPLFKPMGPPKAGETTVFMPNFGAMVFVQAGYSIPWIQSPQVLPQSLTLRNPKSRLQSWGISHFPEEGSWFSLYPPNFFCRHPGRVQCDSPLNRPLEIALTSPLCLWAGPRSGANGICVMLPSSLHSLLLSL